MPKPFDYIAAVKLLNTAIAMSLGDVSDQGFWVDATRNLDKSNTPKTYTPFLITGLLARAVDGAIDPFSIKADSGDHAYSARTLAHSYVVPALKTSQIGIRTTGREPLNNQPFFCYDRVDLIDRVRRQAEFDYLKTVLTSAATLTSEQALYALAAVLNTRRQLDVENAVALPPEGASASSNLADYDDFVHEESEGGRRAQALSAAAMDLCFAEVRTSKVNDPSRHEPGDVSVFASAEVVSLMEVRDKPVTLSDLQHFVDSCLRFGCRRIRMAAVGLGQAPIDLAGLDLGAANGAPCQIEIIYSVEELVRECMMFSNLDPATCLERLATRGSIRLRELEVRSTTLDCWNVLVSQPDRPR